MKRPALLIALAAALIAGCGGGSSDNSGSTSTAALTSCDINGKQQDLGASYVTSIQVAKVSCGQAEKVVLAYHHCRLANGGDAVVSTTFGSTRKLCKTAVRSSRLTGLVK